MSTADESKDNSKEDTKINNGQAAPEHISEYKRQKNIISGVDNGHLALIVGGIGVILGGIAAYPHVRDWIGNITNNKNQQQQIPPPPPPPIEEQSYIPPTPPLPPTTTATAEQQMQQQEQPAQPPQEEEIPDTFYDDELQKRRQLLTGRKHLKYDSQFGAGIANS